MEILLQGIEFTSQLQLHLKENMNILFGDESFEKSALDLTTKIQQCLTDALSLFKNTYSSDVTTILSSDEVFTGDHEHLTSSTKTSSFSDTYDWKSSCEDKAIPGSSTDRKNGFKKRKTTLMHTRAEETPGPVFDGHAWRKYGHKVIQNIEFPRSYYRCTHRNEQGCQATKQVQQTQDNPSMYQTTYMGQHTCKPTASFLDALPGLILDQSHNSGSACIFNFRTSSVESHKPIITSYDQYLVNKPITTNHHQYSLNEYKPKPNITSNGQYLINKPILTSNEKYPLIKPIITNASPNPLQQVATNLFNKPITTSEDQYPLNNIDGISDDKYFDILDFLISDDLWEFDSLSKHMF